VGAEPLPGEAEHPVADREGRDPTADRLHLPANSPPWTFTLGRRSPVKNRVKNGLAPRNPQSVRFTVVACTLTGTSWSLTAGLATSAIRTSSGGP